MLVAVKAPHADFKVEGRIPPRVVTALRSLYDEKVQVIDPEGDELVDIFETDWYRATKARASPGKNVRAYRDNRGLTQEQLARRLGGGMKKQHVSGMERGTRSVSKAVAKKLARIFQTSAARFI